MVGCRGEIRDERGKEMERWVWPKGRDEDDERE